MDRDLLDQELRYWEAMKNRDAAAATEHRHPDPQAMQRLTQLQADDPRPDHGHGFGQIAPGEHVVADDQAVAQTREGIQRNGA